MKELSNPKRLQILQTGRDLFWKFGFRRVTIEEVCREAGVSKMTFYKFFPNKQALVTVIMDEVFDESLIKIRSLRDEHESPEKTLGKILLLKSEGISEDRIKYIYSLDLRYVKQYHEVNIEITRAQIEDAAVEAIANRFHQQRNNLYGYSLKEEATPIELINLRLMCIGETIKPEFQAQEHGDVDPSGALKKKRSVFLPMQNKFQEVDVFDGMKLNFGNKIAGPAIIEQINTTTFVTPEFNVLCDRYGSYTVYVKEKEPEIKGKIGIEQ